MAVKCSDDYSVEKYGNSNAHDLKLCISPSKRSDKGRIVIHPAVTIGRIGKVKDEALCLFYRVATATTCRPDSLGTRTPHTLSYTVLLYSRDKI